MYNDVFVAKQQTLAPVAQLDRVFGYEPKGRAFESLRARQISNEINLLGLTV